MAEKLRFAYDKGADILDISLGDPKEAVSREIEDDFFVRLDPKTNKVIGFSVLNFEKWFKGIDDYRLIPMSAEFSISQLFRAGFWFIDYSGNAQTDDTAECIVQMPSWFVPLNDISTWAYSLTSLSGLGQVAVKPAGVFVVVSEYPRQEFSWTVIVDRGDPIGARTMRENPIVEKKR